MTGVNGGGHATRRRGGRGDRPAVRSVGGPARAVHRSSPTNMRAALPVRLCSGAAQHLDDALRRLAGRPARALLKPVDIDELLHCCVTEQMRGVVWIEITLMN